MNDFLKFVKETEPLRPWLYLSTIAMVVGLALTIADAVDYVRARKRRKPSDRIDTQGLV